MSSSVFCRRSAFHCGAVPLYELHQSDIVRWKKVRVQNGSPNRTVLGNGLSTFHYKNPCGVVECRKQNTGSLASTACEVDADISWSTCGMEECAEAMALESGRSNWQWFMASKSLVPCSMPWNWPCLTLSLNDMQFCRRGLSR